MTISLTRRRIATAAVLTAVCGVVLVNADGPQDQARAGSNPPASVSCVGATQGVLTDGSIQGVKHTVPLVSSSHHLDIPYDASTGQPSAAAKHSPYQFSLRADVGNGVNVRLISTPTTPPAGPSST
jgi:hypothetical protein